jgi:6-carboxyhexanoate--CoA ligase
MWSVRMRASGPRGVHISGAEGIYTQKDVDKAVRNYTRRALIHERGRPESIVIKIDRLPRKPRLISSLPLFTLDCGSPSEAGNIALRLLLRHGVSEDAANAALKVLNDGRSMRGAALIDASTGQRLDMDKTRGVRASRLGIDTSALDALKRRLARRGINTAAVREALVLASKVASCSPVLAELCASDDLGYTTGYLASRKLGYLRIPNIKKTGSPKGGRAFLIKNGSNIKGVIDYLENTAVIVSKLPSWRPRPELNRNERKQRRSP